MTYLVAIFIAIWVFGLLFLSGHYLNDLRVVLNNVAPNAQISTLPRRPDWTSGAAAIVSLASLESLLLAGVALTIGRIFKLDGFETWRISRCDPACLNEAGRRQLDSAARHERFALIWVAAGLAAIVLLSCLSLA